MKPTYLRKTGALPAKSHSRADTASDLRRWRKTGKVRTFRFRDGVLVHRAENEYNPYQLFRIPEPL